MSTKTTIKRISLVAVAALGFGVLSVVPSQAAATAVTFTYTNGTALTTTPTVGTAVQIPVSVAAAGTFEAATSALTATISTSLCVHCEMHMHMLFHPMDMEGLVTATIQVLL
jgi:hypothetical protein